MNALIDRELGLADWVRVRLHLLHCEECRQHLDEYRLVSQAAKCVRNVPGRRRLRLAPIFAVAAVASVVALAVLWPKPKEPQALVYNRTFLTGGAKPLGAIYNEGKYLVVRDFKDGALLATAPGHTRKDAFYAVSQAGNMPFNQPLERVIEDKPPISLKLEKHGSGATIIMEDHPSAKEDAQIVIFFSGPAPNLKDVDIPADRPALFVKIIDPDFLADVVPDQPDKKFVPPSNNKPETINR
ncbi:MAG: hypothetical protein JST51_09620 [Armatimonadetes bacterium]|nr:hypothetical protein [Armatimonadota bacterium]